MEDIIIRTITNPSFGGQVIQKITKLGDLVHKISLIYKAQKVYAGHGLANPTTALINYIGLSIGGHEIDRQYGHWIETWYELTKSNPTGTCSNISKIDENSISHLSSNLDLGVNDFYKKQQAAETGANAYYNNRLNKITNIFGTGISYPSTKFQKSSRCGGVYCEPTYLQELDIGLEETTIGTNKYNDTRGGAAFDEPHGDSNSGSFTTASQSDFSISVLSHIISSSGATEATDLNPLNNIVHTKDIKKTLLTGSIIGLCMLEIPFWFSKDPGLSIPLIAMQNQEVNLDLNFCSSSSGDFSSASYINTDGNKNYISSNGVISNMQNCFNAHSTSDGTISLLKPIRSSTDDKINFNIDVSVLYIYLDTDERRRFAEVSHEYLIEQVQFCSHTGGDININISNFNHPVKEVIWTGRPYISSTITYAVTGPENNDELNNGIHCHKSGVRFQPGHPDNIVGGSIVNCSQTFGFGNPDHVPENAGTAHTIGGGIFSTHGKFVSGLIGPSTPTSLDDCNWSLSLNDIERTIPQPLQQYTRYNVERYHTGYGSVSCPDSIAVYSFALKPEDHQPSGTCNFSKVEKVSLHRYKGQSTDPTNKVDLNIYAINYNVLRVMSGMAALAYTL